MSDRDNSDLVRCTRRLKETRFTGVLEERNKRTGRRANKDILEQEQIRGTGPGS